MRQGRGPVLALASSMLLTLSACAGDEPTETGGATSAGPPGGAGPTGGADPLVTTGPAEPSNPTSSADPQADLVRELTRDATPLTIEAGGGVVLGGLQYGTGPDVVLLAHMGRPSDSQEAWAPLAVALADAGLTVVTYDRRGVCSPTLGTCSTAGDAPREGWRDVVAATRYLQEQGFDTVTVGGASLGAMEVMEALRRTDLEVDGIIWFAGVLSGAYRFAEDDFQDLPTVPKLFISADDDRYGAGEDTRRAAEWSTEPRTLVILPGHPHGTDLWDEGTDGDPGRTVVDAFLDFAAETPSG